MNPGVSSLRMRIAHAVRERRWLVLAFVLTAGTAFRIAQYAANRSLSVDEALLGLNLISKSFVDLTGPLDFTQAAPIGFLELEKLAIVLGGDGEYALRFLPFAMALLALPLFALIARLILDHYGAFVAITAFVLADPLIAYAATAKQYSFDVMAAVAIYAFFMNAGSTVSRRALLVAAPSAAALVWLSHPALFIVISALAWWALRQLYYRHWRMFATTAFVAVIVVSSFAIEYLLSSDNIDRIQRSFASSTPLLGADVRSDYPWLSETVGRLGYLVGLVDTVSGQAAFNVSLLGIWLVRLAVILLLGVAAIGFVSWIRHKPQIAFLTAGPVALVLSIAAFGLYPLVGRTLLFLLPGVALAIGEGSSTLVNRAISRKKLTGALVGAVLLVPIGVLPAKHLFSPRTNEGMKATLHVLDRERRPGDTLYVAFSAQYTLGYYMRCSCSGTALASQWRFDPGRPAMNQQPVALESSRPALVIGRQPQIAGTVAEISRLDEPARVWILLAEMRPPRKRELLSRLRAIGQERFKHIGGGSESSRSELYLFDFET